MPALSVPGSGGNGTRLAKEARNTVILPSQGLKKCPCSVSTQQVGPYACLTLRPMTPYVAIPLDTQKMNGRIELFINKRKLAYFEDVDAWMAAFPYSPDP